MMSNINDTPVVFLAILFMFLEIFIIVLLHFVISRIIYHCLCCSCLFSVTQMDNSQIRADCEILMNNFMTYTILS